MCKDGSMVFDMGRRSHLRAKFHHIGSTANVVYCSVAFQLFGNSHNVNRFLIHVERSDGCVYLLVSGFVKGFGVKQFAHHSKGIFVYHQSSQNHFFQVGGLRRKVSVGVVNWGRLPCSPVCIASFGHVFYLFCASFPMLWGRLSFNINLFLCNFSLFWWVLHRPRAVLQL